MPIELNTHNVNSDLTSAGKENSYGTYHFHFKAIHDKDASALKGQVLLMQRNMGAPRFQYLPRQKDALLDLNVDRRKLICPHAPQGL